MERDIDLQEISDGKLYTAGDMVKAGCQDCAGCSACCRGMGDSIVVDPYDMWNLQRGLGIGAEELLQNRLELHVVDGVILPSLKMEQETDACCFLNEQGRCSIHGFRPGFCRMFPLGRIYEEEGFRYFLQVHECAFPNKSKVKIKKWLDIPELGRYEEYVVRWHGLVKEAGRIVHEIMEQGEYEEISRKLNLYLLNSFYQKAYEREQDFYLQFEPRFQEAQMVLQAYR